MKNTIYILLVILALSVLGCERLIFEPDPLNDPESIFEELWNTFNTDYAPFEQRGVNWQEQYDLCRPLVNQYTTDDELQEIIRQMLSSLNDMHVKFTVPGKKLFCSNIYFNDKPGYDLFALDLITSGYLTSEARELGDGGIVMGWIGTVGYVHFKWIGDNFLDMDKVLDSFTDADGLIIDLRHNGGGDFTYFYSEIGRLTEEDRYTHRSKTKNGPGKEDFTEWHEWYIHPSGKYFNKPLVLLTDRYTGSAAERATMALKTLPNLVHVGDTTNGGHSTMIGKELVNGWYFTVCPQIVEFMDGKSYEGIGMIPDISVQNTEEDMDAGQDRTLEMALERFVN